MALVVALPVSSASLTMPMAPAVKKALNKESIKKDSAAAAIKLGRDPAISASRLCPFSKEVRFRARTGPMAKASAARIGIIARKDNAVLRRNGMHKFRLFLQVLNPLPIMAPISSMLTFQPFPY
jgi:hypothetical protein